ncbi:MAG: hypothetical protein SPL86_10190 [Succiniclasticum sp.]|uniref:hypothetical protein n=1 Tax=Succiniclasticum sp. TaxID=2775030 RepID=UPI002A910675|nr:hypothetical protein [Succiniclasticum sp.]MDY6291839.1 hypothetical protein [Succiniclasticum sp.]
MEITTLNEMYLKVVLNWFLLVRRESKLDSLAKVIGKLSRNIAVLCGENAGK